MKIHLRYAGKSSTLTGPDGTDLEIIQYLQQRGLLPRHGDTRAPRPGQGDWSLQQELMIDRHPDGMVIRPPAVFG